MFAWEDDEGRKISRRSGPRVSHSERRKEISPILEKVTVVEIFVVMLVKYIREFVEVAANRVSVCVC